MISFEILIYILLIHFLADFALQTHEQATKKSTDPVFLLYHVLTYSLVWALASSILFTEWWKMVYYTIVTFSAHFLTDYITSRIGKKFWDKQDVHNGFVVVGLDQVLHYVQLVGVYILLK